MDYYYFRLIRISPTYEDDRKFG